MHTISKEHAGTSLVAYAHDYRGLVPGPLWLARMRARYEHRTSDIDSQLAQDGTCPGMFLAQLANSGSANIRALVAEHPNTTLDILCSLADDDAWAVRARIAQRSGLPDKIYRQLADDVEALVVKKLVANPHIPGELADELYWQRGCRSELAGNPALSALTLQNIAGDSAMCGRVAGNPNTPTGVLSRLWRAPMSAVNAVCGLSTNPNTPSGVLGEIYAKCDGLRKEVLENPNCPAYIIREALEETTSGDADTESAIAKNPALSPEHARWLWEAHPFARQILAGVPWCPLDLIAQAASSTEFPLRAGAAINPKITGKLLWQLANDRELFVRHVAWTHPQVTWDMLSQALPRELITSANVRSDQLPSLEDEVAERVISLAGTWEGTIAQLIGASQLLDV